MSGSGLHAPVFAALFVAPVHLYRSGHSRPIDPIDQALDDDYRIYGGAGADMIFAGLGNVKVDGGSGSDLIAAGSGNAILHGGRGEDLLATNSSGTNLLVGGLGDDALIANRAGTNTLKGGAGDDLFVLKPDLNTPRPQLQFRRTEDCRRPRRRHAPSDHQRSECYRHAGVNRRVLDHQSRVRFRGIPPRRNLSYRWSRRHTRLEQ